MSSGSENGEKRLVEDVPSFIGNPENQSSEDKLNGFLAELEMSIKRHLSRVFGRFSQSGTFLRPLWRFISHYCNMIFQIIKTQIVSFASNVFSSKPSEPQSEKPAGNQETSSMFASTLESMTLPANKENDEEPIDADKHFHGLEIYYTELLEDIDRYGNAHAPHIAANLEGVRNETRFERIMNESGMQMRNEGHEHEAPGTSTGLGATPRASSEPPIPSPNPGSVQDINNGFDSLEREQSEFQRNLEETRRLQQQELEMRRQQRRDNNTRANNESSSIQRRISRTISRNS